MWIRAERHPPRASSYNDGFLICLLGLVTLILSKATQFWNNTIAPCKSNSSFGNSVLQCGFGRRSSRWVSYASLYRNSQSLNSLGWSLLFALKNSIWYTWYRPLSSEFWPSVPKSVHPQCKRLWHPERGTPYSSLTSSFPDPFSPLCILIFHKVRKWTALW